MAHISDVKHYFIRYLNISKCVVILGGKANSCMYGSCVRYKVTFYSICLVLVFESYLMHTSGIGCKVMSLFCLFLSCFRTLMGGRAFLSSSGRAILNS